jgi:hypothetical protein
VGTLAHFFGPKHGGQLLLYSLGTLLVCAVLLVLLHALPARVRRGVTIGATFLAGLYYALEYFILPNPKTRENFLSPATQVLGDVAQVIAAFALILGVYNLARIHAGHLRRRRPGWGNSVLFLVSFAAMAVFATWHDWKDWFPRSPAPPAWVKDPGAPAGAGRDVYTFLFFGLWQNFDAAMFSLLAFYIVSAAYRAFRIRSTEAALLMVTAVILMLGQVPIGMALTDWIPTHGHVPFFNTPLRLFRIEFFAQWILDTINSPVQRAIDFGLGLGVMAMALRVWLSLERGSYFGEEV